MESNRDLAKCVDSARSLYLWFVELPSFRRVREAQGHSCRVGGSVAVRWDVVDRQLVLSFAEEIFMFGAVR